MSAHVIQDTLWKIKNACRFAKKPASTVIVPHQTFAPVHRTTLSILPTNTNATLFANTIVSTGPAFHLTYASATQVSKLLEMSGLAVQNVITVKTGDALHPINVFVIEDTRYTNLTQIAVGLAFLYVTIRVFTENVWHPIDVDVTKDTVGMKKKSSVNRFAKRPVRMGSAHLLISANV